jgi:hypothetical protein
MGIADLGGWLKEHLGANTQPVVQPQQPVHHQQPSTIQPGVPLPTFTPQGQDYSVQGLAPGASTFADWQGLGVLKNPPRGVVYFDPTGQATDQHHGGNSQYMAVPMQMPQFQQFEPMQKIGAR